MSDLKDELMEELRARFLPEFGARPLRRTIQTELDNRIADLLLGGEADPGDTIVADVVDDSLHCTVAKAGAAEAGGTPDAPSPDPAGTTES